MRTSKFEYLFLHGYSPQLAPVELAFNTFKKRLNKECRNKSINLKSIEAFKTVNSPYLHSQEMRSNVISAIFMVKLKII